MNNKDHLGGDLVGKLGGILAEDTKIGLEVLLVRLKLINALRGMR